MQPPEGSKNSTKIGTAILFKSRKDVPPTLQSAAANLDKSQGPTSHQQHTSHVQHTTHVNAMKQAAQRRLQNPQAYKNELRT